MRTYFETVPLDAVATIARFVSHRPLRDDWHNFLSASDAALLFLSGGALAAGSAATFRAIGRAQHEDDDWCGPWRSCACLSDGARPRVALLTTRTHCSFSSVLAAPGARFTHAFFSRRRGVGSEAADAIVKHGHALTHLIVRACAPDEVGHILAARGAQLVGLEVNARDVGVATAVAKYCCKLRELVVLDESLSLCGMLQAVGGGLRELVVRPALTIEGVDAVRKHCREIRVLRVWVEPGLRGELAALYASYGGQLRAAALHQFGVGEIRVVADSCPNVRVEMDVGESHVWVMRVLGARLSGVSVMLHSDTTLKGIRETIRECENLEKIGVLLTEQDVPEEALYNLFDSRMPRLRQIWLPKTLSVDTSLLRVIANCTGGLRVLQMAVDCESAFGFAGLVRENGKLEKVKIFVTGLEIMDDSSDEEEDVLSVPNEIGQDFLCDMVLVFSRATALRELVLTSFPLENESWDYLYSVQNACVALRFRRVHASILGIDYLPSTPELWDETD